MRNLDNDLADLGLTIENAGSQIIVKEGITWRFVADNEEELRDFIDKRKTSHKNLLLIARGKSTHE